MRFKILNKINQGGYGVIYSCIVNNKNLAVKQISLGNNGSLIEAMLMSQIRSPYLNYCYNIESDGYNLYLIQDMAKCDYRKWRDPNLTKHIKQLINGIYVLHNNGFIHGDIKASNVLVYNNGIKLNDFNLSIRYDWLSSITDYKPYTLTHRPPEVFTGSNPTYKSDIWALGCTIFEMKYGYSLFANQRMFEFNDTADITDRFIAAFDHWNHYYNGTPLNNRVEYIIPTLPDNFNPSDPINRLILSCLNPIADKRPSIAELVSDIPEYTIDYGDIYVSDYLIERYIDYIRKYCADDNIIKQSARIYSKINPAELTDIDTILGPLYISHRLIRRETVGDNESVYKISNHLKYRFI